MNEEKTKIPAPITSSSSDVATHLSYMRRDIDQGNINQKQGFDEISKRMDKLDYKLDVMSNGYVTRMDFDEHLKADADHENRLRVLEESRWKVVAITGVITGFLSVAGSYILSMIQHG